MIRTAKCSFPRNCIFFSLMQKFQISMFKKTVGRNLTIKEERKEIRERKATAAVNETQIVAYLLKSRARTHTYT